MRERGLPRQEVLPEVDIVVDRFHVMQNLNNALAVPSSAGRCPRGGASLRSPPFASICRPSACKARRTLQRQADADTKKRLKGFRWVLVTNPENLTEEGQAKLEQMYEDAPEIAQLHELREEFRSIFNDKTIELPEIAHAVPSLRRPSASKLSDWADKICQLAIEPLQKFAQTLQNWHAVLYSLW